MTPPITLSKPVILIAPLDWGLGHATRCIPIIHRLLAHNCTVLIAAEGKIRSLLADEFPNIIFLPLQGYNIHYSRKKWMLPIVLLTQIPKIMAAVKKENRWLQQVVNENKIDAVISDNRYGLYQDSVPSIILTHQLRIQSGKGQRWDDLLQWLHYRFINRFHCCWVPDVVGKDSLAGNLSHPADMPVIPTKYMGPLSRFEPCNSNGNKHLLILLSGPVPQRTMLEKKLLSQLVNYQEPVILVRGLPGSSARPQVNKNVEVYNHLPATELQQKMCDASYIISRCGYSTVMDIAALHCKSILIPTPGQTEQEYLAAQLMKNDRALCIEQHQFELQAALTSASVFPYKWPQWPNTGALDEAITDLLKQIKSNITKSEYKNLPA
jgi:uncharacterized protein (TIGR00661 family)